ncbi:DUF397 domain-containing protein [Embleya sp. NPDC020886]|uniref:DUF397 domain-containing protein n=1 Tax=Embleya sp. NPDC020886 TaxID=3363980 RepID=UPI003790424F
MTKAHPGPAHWRRSSFSGQAAPECIEVATFDGAVGTRDSKNPSVGHITVTPASWSALLNTIKA